MSTILDIDHIKNPNFFSSVEFTNFLDFEKKVYQNRESFIREMKYGKVFVVRKVISSQIIDEIKNNVHLFGIKNPSGWHDPIKGVPNFHQMDNQLDYFKTKKCAHVFNFFNWNDDELGVFKYFDHLLKLFNFINGNSERIDKDLINRLQVHHYPKRAGFMDYHQDPDMIVKTLAILYMSEYGVDYKSGGLNLIDKNSKKILIDENVHKGDMVFAYPSIKHGCDLIDAKEKSKNVDWKDASGRWLFLFNTLMVKEKN